MEELKKIGVLVRVGEASMAIAHRLKQTVSSAGLSKKNVIALLECFSKLKKLQNRVPEDIADFFCNEKWLQTILDIRSPSDSILHDQKWEQVYPMIATLPFIDDRDSCYGKEVYKYKTELKALGVIVEFKEGAKFIISGLSIPKDPSVMTRQNVYASLECIRNLKERRMTALPDEFMKMISQKWLKTSMGYKSPNECTLFDSKWRPYLKVEDDIFIDEYFYGLKMLSYRDELFEIGVVVDVDHGCSLLAHHLKCHSEVAVLTRIYLYLSKSKWKPNKEYVGLVQIPDGSNRGKWVNSYSCVLHDKDKLFNSRLCVLEKYYGRELLDFFATVFGVKRSPSVDDYCILWTTWEFTSHQLTISECSAS